MNTGASALNLMSLAHEIPTYPLS